MTTTCLFNVYGEVVGSARPRVTRHGTYIPKKTREFRKRIQEAFAAQCGGRFAPIEGPVHLEIIVQRSLPKSRPKKIVSEPDTYKPDTDNIAKNVMDALNGIAWKDDSQITSLSVQKRHRMRVPEHITVHISASDT